MLHKMTAPRKYAVQFRSDTGRVMAGTVNDEQTDLTEDREDVTDNAVLSVAEYVLRQFDGAVQVDYDGGLTYQISVTKIGPPDPTNGMRYGLHPDGRVVGY